MDGSTVVEATLRCCENFRKACERKRPQGRHLSQAPNASRITIEVKGRGVMVGLDKWPEGKL